jgi:hypothetical protein
LPQLPHTHQKKKKKKKKICHQLYISAAEIIFFFLPATIHSIRPTSPGANDGPPTRKKTKLLERRPTDVHDHCRDPGADDRVLLLVFRPLGPAGQLRQSRRQTTL